MTFLGRLWRAEIAGLAALFICAFLMGAYGFIESYVWSVKGLKLLIAPLDAAWLVFSYAGIIGLVAVVFYGAPAYALLRHRLLASWRTVTLVGSVPGLAILPFDASLGAWFVVGGIAVAFTTHFLNLRFLADEPAL